MLDIHKKYFWDHSENASPPYKLRRIIEYASFPDLVKYPYEEVKENLPLLDISKLRTAEDRKKLMAHLQPLAAKADSWDELFELFFQLDLRPSPDSTIFQVAAS